MTEDEEVASLKRGARRGRTESITDNVMRAYYPEVHLHICIRMRCPKGGYGFKFCGPQFGDLSPHEQSSINSRFQMEAGRGQPTFTDSIQEGLDMLTRETEAFRFETHRGQIIERFCSVPPSEIGKGIVHETCTDCMKKETKL